MNKALLCLSVFFLTYSLFASQESTVVKFYLNDGNPPIIHDISDIDNISLISGKYRTHDEEFFISIILMDNYETINIEAIKFRTRW